MTVRDVQGGSEKLFLISVFHFPFVLIWERRLVDCGVVDIAASGVGLLSLMVFLEGGTAGLWIEIK